MSHDPSQRRRRLTKQCARVRSAPSRVTLWGVGSGPGRVMSVYYLHVSHIYQKATKLVMHSCAMLKWLHRALRCAASHFQKCIRSAKRGMYHTCIGFGSIFSMFCCIVLKLYSVRKKQPMLSRLNQNYNLNTLPFPQFNCFCSLRSPCQLSG